MLMTFRGNEARSDESPAEVSTKKRGEKIDKLDM